MLYAPYPFNAPFLNSAFLLLRSTSLHTPKFYSTATQLLSSFFLKILHISVLFVHAIFAMPLHAHSGPNSSTSRVLCLIIIMTLQLLRHLFPCVQHHWVFYLDFATSLAVEDLCFLCLRRSYPFYFHLHISMLIHLSIPLRVVFLHSTKFGDSSSPLVITQRSLRILWQTPSMVSSSFTVSFISSPLIVLMFTSIVGLTLMGSCVIYPFFTFTIRRF
jgi:hypothetical protein